MKNNNLYTNLRISLTGGLKAICINSLYDSLHNSLHNRLFTSLASNLPYNTHSLSIRASLRLNDYKPEGT